MCRQYSYTEYGKRTNSDTKSANSQVSGNCERTLGTGARDTVDSGDGDGAGAGARGESNPPDGSLRSSPSRDRNALAYRPKHTHTCCPM
jgi:hypothetical protein